MGEHHRLLRVDAAGEVVDDDVVDVVDNVFGRVAIGYNLIIGDYDICVDATILQLYSPLQRAEIVAEMQAPRWAVSR